MADTIQQQILKVLQKVKRPGSFCATGPLPPVLPGLEVEGVGPIAFPLTEDRAQALKKRARQAPYGKGEQTLVDTDVRRVWEIEADQVRLDNPEWSNVLADALQRAQSEMGLEKQPLKAHLHKLLLYDPGSFFLPHRDGEKMDRMVATLVITLPSAHEGGELIIRHEGREIVVDFGGPGSAFATQFAAFYADCEHEIRPVTQGHRLALVYNLTLAKAKRNVTAPTIKPQIDAITRILRQWAERAAADPEDDSWPLKLAVILGHGYTKAGLTYETLKGMDRAKATVLFDAARQANCQASLALITCWERGSAEPLDYADFAGMDAEDCEIGEIFDSSLIAESFMDLDGTPLNFGQIDVEEEELVASGPIATGQPDKKEFEGYTGNEGMTLERWYRRAALMLWPTVFHFDVLCRTSIHSAVGGLALMVKQWEPTKGTKRQDLYHECVEFAAHIIDNWPNREQFDWFTPKEKPEPDDFLPLLNKLGDVSLISRWIREVLVQAPNVHPGKELGNVCEQYGWKTFAAELKALFKQTDVKTVERQAEILADLCSRSDKDGNRHEFCQELADAMLNALERWDRRPEPEDWYVQTPDRAALSMYLLRAFLELDGDALLERLTGHVQDHVNKYPYLDIQVPVILSLQPWLKRKVKRPSPPLRSWLQALIAELEQRTADPPRPFKDWRRAAPIQCKCADCQELRNFLENPNLNILRLPLNKERRMHLHRTIDTLQLDTTHVTERRGRPFTLACTKTDDSYQRALHAHKLNLHSLGRLRQLLTWHDSLGRPSASKRKSNGKRTPSKS